MLTLVFTDLADSTALKTRHGDSAIESLLTRHRDHVTRLAAECSGRIIDWAGDGCFLTFEISSAGVIFALRLQQVHTEEPDLPGVRIGMHHGEVSETPNPAGGPPRVGGLAVDLAARISGLAKPGQVLMSSAVYNSARQRLGVEAFGQPVLWQTHGTYSLKGFDEPMDIGEAALERLAPLEAPTSGDKAKLIRRATPARPASVSGRKFVLLSSCAILLFAVAGVAYFAARSGNTIASPATAPASVAPGGVKTATNDGAGIPAFGDRPAIAVLPFDNFSPDADQAFFADGLAEDLITRLASWRAFPVISRNSSFKYRGGDLDIKSVSAELGARYLVEGSVRREGEQIRVTAQLIDASTGEHVWAEKYDREIKDVFSLQDEISSTIAASLVTDLNRAEAERARQRGTENIEAWSLYQLGLQHYDRFSREGFAEAERLFEQAVERDPRFSTALGMLAFSNIWEIALGWSDAPDQLAATALERARRAVELDPREPIAHGALCWAYIMHNDVRNALDSGKRVVDLNPSMPEAWIYFGWAQLLAGDPEACIVSSLRAQRLSPQGTMIVVNDNLAWAYFETKRYEESLEMARRLIAERSDYFMGHVYIAMNSVEIGRVDDAKSAIADARRIQPGLSISQVQQFLGLSRPEIDARRNAALRQAGLE